MIVSSTCRVFSTLAGMECRDQPFLAVGGGQQHDAHGLAVHAVGSMRASSWERWTSGSGTGWAWNPLAVRTCRNTLLALCLKRGTGDDHIGAVANGHIGYDGVLSVEAH